MNKPTPLADVHVVLGVTAAISVPFFHHVPAALCLEGAKISIVSAPGAAAKRFCCKEPAQSLEIPLRREISILADCRALYKLFRVFQRLRPTIIDFGTPKAGLLGMLAGWLVRIP